MGNLINPHVTRLGQTYFSDTRWVSFLNCNYSFLLSNDLFLYSYINWFIKHFQFLKFFYGTDEQYVSHFNILRHPYGITVVLFLRLVNFNNKNGNFFRWFLSDLRKYFFGLKNLVRAKEQSQMKLYYQKNVLVFSKIRRPVHKIKDIFNPFRNVLFKKPIKKLYQLPLWNERDLSDIHNQYISRADRKDKKIDFFALTLFPFSIQKNIIKRIYFKYGILKNFSGVTEKNSNLLGFNYNPIYVLKNLFEKKDNNLSWRFDILQGLWYIFYLKMIRSQVNFNTSLINSFIYRLNYSFDIILLIFLNNFKKLQLFFNIFSVRFSSNTEIKNLLWWNTNSFFNSSILNSVNSYNNLKFINNVTYNKRKRIKLLKLLNNNNLINNLGYNINLLNVMSSKDKAVLEKKDLIFNNFSENFNNFSIINNNYLNVYNLVLCLRYFGYNFLNFKNFINQYKISNNFNNNDNLMQIYNLLFNYNINYNKNLQELNKKQINFSEDFNKTLFIINRKIYILKLVEKYMQTCISIWVESFQLGLSFAKTKNYISSNITLMLLKLSPARLTAPLVNNYIVRNLLIGHSLNRIIYPLLNQAYKPFRSDIFWGFKIGCFGRFWRRGRARKVWFNEGSAPLSTISAWVDYKYNFVKLRNGTCSIKVFITYRKNFSYSI